MSVYRAHRASIFFGTQMLSAYRPLKNYSSAWASTAVRSFVSEITCTELRNNTCVPNVSSLRDMLNSCGTKNDPVLKTLMQRSLEAYRANRQEVDDGLGRILSENKLVLFLEGSVDAPKSLLSLNVVKMLTQLQAVPFVAVDVTTHPAILGFALTHGKNGRVPYLFFNGTCLGSHDSLMQLYKNGGLALRVANQLPHPSTHFKGELPIALY